MGIHVISGSLTPHHLVDFDRMEESGSQPYAVVDPARHRSQDMVFHLRHMLHHPFDCSDPDMELHREVGHDVRFNVWVTRAIAPLPSTLMGASARCIST